MYSRQFVLVSTVCFSIVCCSRIAQGQDTETQVKPQKVQRQQAQRAAKGKKARNFAPLPPDTNTLSYCRVMAAYTAIPSTAHPAGIMDQINNPSTNAETKKALRNSFIEAAIFEIRESHRYYWTNAAMHRAWFNFSMDTLIAASTAVIASAGGKGTKAAIGAAATAIGGIKGAFSSDFDAAQSRTQLLAAMEINSTRNAEAIQTKTAKPYSEYEFAEACVDINKLYESGSEGYTYSTVTETPKK